VLRFAKDLGYTKIAANIGVSAARIGQLQQIALKILRQKLEADGDPCLPNL